MHAMGLHSALAVKRQRKRREEQKKAKERRYSTQSTESGLGESRSSFASPRNSIGSLDKKKRKGRRKIVSTKVTSTDSKVASSVGMLHVGVVFIVLGLFLMGSGMMPDDIDTWEYRSMERVYEFLLAASVCLFIGILLICINKIITNKEEKDLNAFIERQLTRSKSGHRLVRDSETGSLVPPRNANNRRSMPESMEFENEIPNGQPHLHTPRSPPPISVTTPRSDLERILEEEISEKDNNTKYETKNNEENNKLMSNGHYYDNLPIYDN